MPDLEEGSSESIPVDASSEILELPAAQFLAGTVEPETDVEEPEVGDLDDLLRSLSVDDEVEGSGTAGFEPLDSEEPPTTGVISTDAYLAEFEGDVALNSGLSDEITALTGGGAAGRNRPVTTVSKIPEPGEDVILHRDQLVDRDLVMQIIEGIEKL